MSNQYQFLEKAAPAYNLGMGIIPLEPGTKDPLTQALPETNRGAHISTPLFTKRATPEQLFEWGKKYPDANYGIVCGLPSEINSHFLYVVDIEDRGLFEEKLQEIRALYGNTQSVRSRRGGHIYLLSSAPVLSKNRYLKEGFEIKGQGNYVLGEGCRHPEGGWYELHSDPGIFAMTDVLSFCDIDPIPLSAIEQRKSYRAYRIARQKHQLALQGKFYNKATKEPYDRSRVMSSIVTACRNQDIDKDTIRHMLDKIALTDKQGRNISTHYQALLEKDGRGVADRSLERCWQYAGSRLFTPEALALRQQMEQLTHWVESQPWAGLVKRSVLLAHIRRSYDACKRIYHLDVRTGAELAQCHRDTFRAKTDALCDGGLIEKTSAIRGSGIPNLYELIPEMFIGNSGGKILQFQTQTSPPYGCPCPKSEKNVDIKSLTDADRYHGVFEHGGLGRACERVWLCVQGQRLTQREVRERTGLSVGSVSRCLIKLRKWGMVIQSNRHYEAVQNPDFVHISRQLGTQNKPLKRRIIHEGHRRKYRGGS